MIRYWRMPTPEAPGEAPTRVVLARETGPRGCALVSLVPTTSGREHRLEGDRIAGEIGVWVR